MRIKDVVSVVGRSGFFNRDLAAVKAGARADGFAYPGKPISPGFARIVQPGTAIRSYCCSRTARSPSATAPM